MGRIGLPRGHSDNERMQFYQNIGFTGGTASVTTYDKQVLLNAVLNGTINPGKIFNAEFELTAINDAYQAMVQRKAIKAMVNIE